MNQSFVCGLFFCLAAFVAAQEQPSFADIEPLLETYCHQCHDAGVQKGEFRIDTYTTYGDVLKDRKHWLKVLEQLETREMPTKKPFPTEAEYEIMVEWVDRAVNDIDWEKLKHPGHVTLPRLTNSEYDRTIRDLLGINVEASRILSPDGEGKSGFTNDRDNLFISSSMLEKYFTAAEWAIDTLQGLNAEPAERHLESEAMFMTESRTALSQFSDGSKGYSLNRGQMTLYENVQADHRGFYEFRVRFRSSTLGKTGILLRINDELRGELETVGTDMQEHSLTVFLNPGSHQMAWNIKQYPKPPKPKKNSSKPEHTPVPENANQIVGVQSRERQPVFTLSEEESTNRTLNAAVKKWNSYQLGIQRPYEWLRLHGPDGNPNELKRFTNYVKDRSLPLQKLSQEIAGMLGISVEDFQSRFENENRESLTDRKNLIAYADNLQTIKLATGNAGIDWIKVNGPILPKSSHRQERAKSAANALENGNRWNAWLPTFLTRAFRRELNETELGKYRNIYQLERKQGKAHSEAARRCLLAILISPKFLYRAEEIPAKPGSDPFPLTTEQLASRLSYFIWQTMPDDRLRDVDLTNREVIAGEIDRMLADPLAAIFFSSFPGQWLGYEALGNSVLPDQKKFPTFSDDLAKAMKKETQLWFQHVFRNNRPIADLLQSGETYLNDILAAHYQINGRFREDFQLVSLPEGEASNRGGLLGMASLLTATSTPTRTSPVLRGVFVMERLLGDDPGLPPADAGELPGNAGGRGKTLREELAIHRDAEACASCHDKIDPIGFGLDHFDAVGRFREIDGKKPIDASGELPDGTKFNGVADLREYLLTTRKDDFARIVVERLLSYALGRELQTYDEPATVEILKQTKSENYRAADLIKAVAMSYPFQNQHPEAEWNP